MSGRVIGLDVGHKTIGIALSDELRMSAHSVTTLARRGIKEDVRVLVAMVQKHEVTEVVVGLPLELSGRAGKRAERVRALSAALASALGEHIAVHEWDERFSTKAVERVLLEADLSRQKRKKVIDKQAAAYILQGWLDAREAAE